MKIFNKKLGARIRKLRDGFKLSQEDVAKKLGISRVSLSQIENGGRKMTAEEVVKLSGMFKVDTDILLDLKKDMKVTIEKEQGCSIDAPKSDIRISVPQKNLSKFKEVLLYVLNKIGSKPNIGETVLYKLLYFIDFDFYEKYEEQLVGASYIKNHYGPTPVEFKEIINEMKDKDLVEIQNQYFQYPQRKYLPLRPPDLSLLKANEIKAIDEILERLSDMNANQISEYSHGDVPWKTTDDGEIIDYESVFYRAVPYSVRKYGEDEEDI
ncbi:MAG: type II toxin-antitoxin system antitoxin SocA domain-containing protein [Candidatus Omnitrophota bacterium]